MIALETVCVIATCVFLVGFLFGRVSGSPIVIPLINKQGWSSDELTPSDN